MSGYNINRKRSQNPTTWTEEEEADIKAMLIAFHRKYPRRTYAAIASKSLKMANAATETGEVWERCFA